MEEKEKIRVLVKEPNKEPYFKEIEPKLENYQEIVGGWIECVEMPGVKNVDIYVNEEGKLDRLDGNFWLPEYEDCVVGTCYFVGYNPKEGSAVSITDEQAKKCTKYSNYYSIPEGLDLYLDFHILKAYMNKRYKIQKKKQAVL